MDTTTVDSANPSFLAAPGEMAARIRAHDWASTELGRPEGWRPSLKAMVRMALTTRHPIFIFWGREHICLYNDAYSASLGPEKHPSLLGMRGRDGWPEIWPIIGPQIDLVLAGNGSTWHENQLVPILRHGAIQDVYWTYSYGPIDDGEAPNGIGGVLVVCTETTSQVVAEKRMAAEREHFAQLFEQSPSFMALLRGPTHVFEMANPSYMRLVGHRKILGLSVAQALPDALEQGYVARLDEVYRSGRAFTAFGSKFVMHESDGSASLERYVDFVYQPIVDDQGRVSGIFVEGVDVSGRQAADEELRRLAARLQEEDRRKTEFLATLAHELRNPLAPLRSGLEVLRLAHDEPATAPLRDMMERQLRHLVHLVDDLMDISRISSGKILLKRETMDLRVVLETALETSRPLIEAKRHHLALALGAPLPVYVDRVRMAQVVSNLLNNAAKYTGQGGEIELAARRDGRDAVVSVSDNGVGIAQEQLESVFDMFAQAGVPGSQLDSGLGIGLTLVRRLTEMHGGSVSAARAPGGGSVLSLRIPLAEDAQAVAAETARQSQESAQPGGLRVLVADDNIDAASSLCELIVMLGHDAREAHDGNDALRVAGTFRPELVFLDIGMPHKDGYQTAREMRGVPGLEKTILVALTGWGNPGDRELARKAGFDHHLTKPADLSAIQKLLDLAQAARKG